MNNEEIKALLRDLSEKAEYEGKSETVHISFDPDEKEEEQSTERESEPEPDFSDDGENDEGERPARRKRRGFSLGSLLSDLKPKNASSPGRRAKKPKAEERGEELPEEDAGQQDDGEDNVDAEQFRLPQMKTYTPRTRKPADAGAPEMTAEAAGSGKPEMTAEAAGVKEPEMTAQASGVKEPETFPEAESAKRPEMTAQASGSKEPETSPEAENAGGPEMTAQAAGSKEPETSPEAENAKGPEMPAEAAGSGKPEIPAEEAAGLPEGALSSGASKELTDEEIFEMPDFLKGKAKPSTLKPEQTSKPRSIEEALGDLDFTPVPTPEFLKEQPDQKQREEDEDRDETLEETSEEERASAKSGEMSESDEAKTPGGEMRSLEEIEVSFDSDDDETKEKAKKKPRRRKERKGGGFKEGLSRAADFLRRKGISARELIMIAAGLLLLILVAVLLLRSLGGGKEPENVTADEGLRVRLLSEPSAWTKSGEVTLSIRTKEDIQDIRIDGESMEFTGSNRTELTFETSSDVIEVEVTSDAVRRAQVTTAFIDGEAPDLTVSRSGDTVTITTSDERSGLAGVYYGVIMPPSNVPLYQDYTGPFQVEDGLWYSYYAVDAAGNMTEPVITNMSEASEVSMTQTQLSLFPGETSQVTAFASPYGAYLNGLTVENSNEDVISLSENGTVKALSEGTATITASANGLPSATCEVTVRKDADLTITTLGDVTLGYDDNFSPAGRLSTYADQYGYSYFFENVRSILAEDDLTFANLEGPLTDRGERQYKTFAFHGSPSYTQILQDGSIEAVTLANNHSGDYGEIGLEDTKQYLKEAGITYCSEDEVAFTEVQGVKVALIGIYAVDQEDKSAQVSTSIAKAKNGGADLIVVAFHWGTELVATPDSVQRSLGHLAIDEGADLVVGHHPHVLQGIEEYNGEYIVYSLGNFCFGGNTNPAEYETIIFQQSFHLGGRGSAESTGVNIIPCRISSNTGSNNYQPTPAQGEEANQIRAKLNALCEEFGTSF